MFKIGYCAPKLDGVENPLTSRKQNIYRLLSLGILPPALDPSGNQGNQGNQGIPGLQELFVLGRSVKEGEEGQSLFQVMLQCHSWESDPTSQGAPINPINIWVN